MNVRLQARAFHAAESAPDSQVLAAQKRWAFFRKGRALEMAS
jgi:hypothetical protein